MAECRVRAADTSTEVMNGAPVSEAVFATRPAPAGLPVTRMITPASVARLFRIGQKQIGAQPLVTVDRRVTDEATCCRMKQQSAD